MKKIIAFAFAISVSIATFAKASDKQLQLTTPNTASVIFDATKTASFEIKFSETCTASYQGISGMDMAKYAKINGEWEEEWAYGSSAFTEDWNKRNKKGMQIVKSNNADYHIVVTIDSFKEMAAFNVWWEITQGTVEILDNSGKQVVQYNIHEYYECAKGFKAMKLRNRIYETIAGLSESCIYMAKNAK